MIYNALGASAINSDLVITNGNDTYICIMDPTRINRASATPIEEQEGWQIKLYHTTVDENTGIERTQTLYPEGRDSYDFAPKNIANYNFKYKI